VRSPNRLGGGCILQPIDAIVRNKPRQGPSLVCCVCVAFESISLFKGSPCQARTLVCPRSGYGSRLSRMVRVCVLAFVSGVESSMTCGAC
jgi:hypothetical protein